MQFKADMMKSAPGAASLTESQIGRDLLSESQLMSPTLKTGSTPLPLGSGDVLGSQSRSGIDMAKMLGADPEMARAMFQYRSSMRSSPYGGFGSPGRHMTGSSDRFLSPPLESSGAGLSIPDRARAVTAPELQRTLAAPEVSQSLDTYREGLPGHGPGIREAAERLGLLDVSPMDKVRSMATDLHLPVQSAPGPLNAQQARLAMATRLPDKGRMWPGGATLGLGGAMASPILAALLGQAAA
jgi:hypothetical protein